MISPVCSERFPRPTARTSPCWGFSLAVSGMTKPLAVVSSDSPGLTTMRSSRGCRFICALPPLMTCVLRTCSLHVEQLAGRLRRPTKHRLRLRVASPERLGSLSTLRLRVLNVGAPAGGRNQRLLAACPTSLRRLRLTELALFSGQAEVGVGAGVEGRRTVVAEPPV